MSKLKIAATFIDGGQTSDAGKICYHYSLIIENYGNKDVKLKIKHIYYESVSDEATSPDTQNINYKLIFPICDYDETFFDKQELCLITQAKSFQSHTKQKITYHTNGKLTTNSIQIFADDQIINIELDISKYKEPFYKKIYKFITNKFIIGFLFCVLGIFGSIIVERWVWHKPTTSLCK